ncbi:TPA: hypothetical protein KNT04_002624 [Clostridioides difficile]|nr:hypothetical protein [Clostridioides difficile]
MFMYNDSKTCEMVKFCGLSSREQINNGLYENSSDIFTIMSYKLYRCTLDIDYLIECSYFEVAKLFRYHYEIINPSCIYYSVLENIYIKPKSLKEFTKFCILGYLCLEKDDKCITLNKYYNNLSEDKKVKLGIPNYKTLQRRWNELNINNHIYNEEHAFENYKNKKKCHHISEYQINELEFLLENYDTEFLKSFRIKTPNKLDFDKLKKYVKLARNYTLNSDDKFKNIKFYQLERRTSFELIKEIANQIEKNNYNYLDDNGNYVCKLWYYLRKIPDIKNRKIYIEIFFKLTDEDKDTLLDELIDLEIIYKILISYSLYLINGYKKEEIQKYTEKMEKSFIEYYNLNEYETVKASNNNTEIYEYLFKKINITNELFSILEKIFNLEKKSENIGSNMKQNIEKFKKFDNEFEILDYENMEELLKEAKFIYKNIK